MIKEVIIYRGPNAVYRGRPDGLELVSDEGDTVHIDLNTHKAYYITRDGKTHVELLSPEDLFGPAGFGEAGLADPPLPTLPPSTPEGGGDPEVNSTPPEPKENP